ncbi:hypothetical protein [Gracilibacillus massiliensis]|nr:hypothetical protein [Gracilibacillus massiliensis]
MENEVFIAYNFFSAGKTEIMNADQQVIGHLDLKSAFSSSVAIYNEQEV